MVYLKNEITGGGIGAGDLAPDEFFEGGKTMAEVKRRACAALLALVLLLGCAPETLAAETAATVQLTKTEGTVSVSNRSGRAVSPVENMRIYNGYRLETEEASYAWLNLDSSKFVKLDAVSELEVRKDGKKLELLLNEGNLFFNVTEPLEEDESLNIRVSTMTVGIRGTCGWVKTIDQWTSQVYVLEGAIQASVTDPVTSETKTETVAAGESALCVVYPQDREGVKCDILRAPFSEADIDGFVLTEAVPDSGLCGRIYDGSDLDLRDFPEDPADRLRQDQNAVGEKMAGIEAQVSRQDDHIATDPVWTDSTPPAPPSVDSGSGGGGNSSSGGSSGGGGSNSGSGGGNSSSDPPPTPPTPPSGLVMKLTDDRLMEILSNQTSVSVLANTDSADTTRKKNVLEVDSGLLVSAGRTLTLQSGIDLEVQSGQNLQVDGTLDLAGNLDNAGNVYVTSSHTLRVGGNFTNRGLLSLSSTGRVVIDGTFTNTGGMAALTPGAKVLARRFQLTDPITDWAVSSDSDGGYYSLVYTGGTDTPPPAPSGYTITFDPNGGRLDTTTAVTDADGRLASLPTPVRTGYAFDGWYYAGRPVKEDFLFTSDIKLSAYWTLLNTVTWDYDEATQTLYIGGQGKMPSSYLSWKDENIKTVIIDEGVISICDNAFNGCKSLESVTIPEGVDSIGQRAFSGCTNLKSVTIPDSTRFLYDFAFAGCTSLTSLTIPKKLMRIYPGTFYNCANLSEFQVDPENNYFTADDGILFSKEKYTLAVYPPARPGASYAIPTGVITVGDYAFCRCGQLTEVTIPDTVKTIGANAFANTSLTAVTVPASVTDLGSYAFYECNSLKSAVVEGNITCICAHTFAYCEALESVTLSGSAKYIDIYAFCKNQNLATVDLSGGALRIAKKAFLDCPGLTNLVLPDNLQTIEEEAFYNCSSLTAVKIPKNVTTIGKNAFDRCYKLAELEVDPENTAFSSENGVLFDKEKTKLICYPKKKPGTSYEIPGTVTEICTSAFSGCTQLTGVTIPASVTRIDQGAFSGCTGLTTVHYGGTEEQWNAITIGADNEPLTNANRNR